MCDVFGVFSYLVLLSLTLASVLYIIYLLLCFSTMSLTLASVLYIIYTYFMFSTM